MEFKAQYLDGESPIERELTVIWEIEGFRFEENGEIWTARDYKLDYNSNMLTVSHISTLQSFRISNFAPDTAALMGLQAKATPKSLGLRKAVALTVVTVALFVSMYASIRPLSYGLARMVSPEDEQRVFDRITPLRVLNESRCQQWDAQNLIQNLANKLTVPGEKAPSVEILDWKMVNAFAFPGQRIYVTQGLLDSLNTSEQLLAVLAHEYGHVKLRHNVGETISNLLKAFLWSIALGDFSGAFIIDPKLAKDMSDASYSRDLERAADHYAAQQLLGHEHDPKALGSALLAMTESLKEEEQDRPRILRKIFEIHEQLFSTHPATMERVGQLLESYPQTFAHEPLDRQSWKFLKNACRSKSSKNR